MASEPRSWRMLRMLVASADGLKLCEFLGGLTDLQETPRHAAAATVTMLRDMRLKGRVSFEPGRGGAGGGGTYRITAIGQAWLARKVCARGEPEESAEAIAVTGAMRGEARTVVLTRARAGQARPDLVNSVFALALAPATA